MFMMTPVELCFIVMISVNKMQYFKYCEVINRLIKYWSIIIIIEYDDGYQCGPVVKNQSRNNTSNYHDKLQLGAQGAFASFVSF